jgi:hypothetical protein
MNTNKNNMAPSIRTFLDKKNNKKLGKIKQRERLKTLTWLGKVLSKEANEVDIILKNLTRRGGMYENLLNT